MSRNPPRPAEALLKLIVPAEEQESIPGDLAEEFSTMNRSNLWYWRQVMRSSGYLACRSFGKPSLGVLTGIVVLAAGIFLIEICARLMLPRFPHVQPLDFAFTFTLLGIGVTSAAAGGYVATRLAGRVDKQISLILGVFFLAMTGVWLARGVASTAPIWFKDGLILLVLPAVFLGRRLWMKRIENA